MKIFLRIIVFLASIPFFGQQIGVRKAQEFKYNIKDSTLVVIKSTNEQLFFKDLYKLDKTYDNYTLFPKSEDVDGNVISFYYIEKSGLENQDQVVEKFSKIEINRKDIFDNIIDLNKIEDKIILIIIQIQLEFPMINVDAIKEAESAALKRNNCISIILTNSSKEQAKQFAKENGLASAIIPNAVFTTMQFNKKRFPAYIILNSDKTIHSELKYHYEVETALSSLD